MIRKTTRREKEDRIQEEDENYEQTDKENEVEGRVDDYDAMSYRR
jgi:hypothetical protein